MHTQAESDRSHRPHPAATLSAATGLLLYLLTLAGEARRMPLGPLVPARSLEGRVEAVATVLHRP